MFMKYTINQNEKIIDLEKAKKELEEKNQELEIDNFNTKRECLNYIGMLDDAQEEFLHILDNIEELLTNNDYSRPDIKNSKVLEYVRQQQNIIIKDLEINNEPVSDHQSEN